MCFSAYWSSFCELLVEALQRVGPGLLAILDLVEFLFQPRRVLRIEDVFEVLDQQIGDDKADLGGDKLPADLLHVLALLDGADNGGVRRRAADAALFELLHQRRFVETRRRLGEVLFRAEAFQRQLLAFDQQRQLVLQRLIFFVLAVLGLFVNFQEAFELQDRAGNAEAI